MKRLLSVVIVVVLALSLFAGTSQADYSNFSLNITSLNHAQYYYWQLFDSSIQTALQNNPNNVITDVKITFTGIKDAVDFDSFNFLWLSYADSKPSGGWVSGANSNAFIFNDSDYNGRIQPGPYPFDNVLQARPGVDFSMGAAPASDPNAPGYYWRDSSPGWNSNKKTFSVSFFDQQLDMIQVTNFFRDGRIWIGMDSDCMFLVDDVSTIVTFTNNKVPEPSSLMLFGTGLIGLGFFSIRRKKLG
jgi:hypothetical protein